MTEKIVVGALENNLVVAEKLDKIVVGKVWIDFVALYVSELARCRYIIASKKQQLTYRFQVLVVLSKVVGDAQVAQFDRV